MKPQVKSTKSVKSSGITTSVKFGIKSSGLHHILGILRDQLYSDKILAVIREYSCNAVDAQVQAGKGDVPIEVTLPTRLKLDFKVRDYGDALNDQEIQDVYAFYGESTKRNSNDQIGMLGIGSKSAFAYGDNFVINSYIDGTKHIYNAFIDPSQIGQISKIGTEPTSEKNGIEITVPVRLEDVDEFQTKARNLFKWFKVRPVTKGVKYEYTDCDVLFEGSNWKYLDNSSVSRWDRGDSTLVMGNIGYPINRYNLELNEEDAKLENLLHGNLVLDMNIGDVEISASRENLQYTDYTRKNITNTLKKVKKELSSKITQQFNECKTLFEAKQLWGCVFDVGSNLYELRGILRDNLLWNKTSVSSSTINCSSQVKDYDKNHNSKRPDIELHKFKLPYRGKRYRAVGCHQIDCSRNTVVIENDMPDRRGSLGKVLDLIINQKKEVYLIKFNNAKTRKELKAQGLDCEMTKLSDLPKRPLKDFGYATGSVSVGRTSQSNKRHSTKEFTLDWGKLNQINWSDARSSIWNVGEVDLGDDSEGVYVELDRFYISGKVKEAVFHSEEVHPRNLRNLVKQLKEILKIKLPTLHGFKINSKSLEKVKANKNWQPFWEWASSAIREQLDTQNIEQKYINRETTMSVISDFSWLNSKLYDTPSEFADLLVKGKAKTLFEQLTFMRHEQDKSVLDGCRDLVEQFNLKLNSTLKPDHDLAELAQEVHERYSMLGHCQMGYWASDVACMRKDIVNYINIIDICSPNV